MFLTSGLIDEKLFREMGFRLVAKRSKVMLIAAMCFGIALGIVEIVLGSRGFAIVMFAASLFALGELFFIRSSTVMQNLKQMEENEGEPVVDCSTAFSDLGLLMKNNRTGKASYLRYQSLVNIVKLPSVFAIFTSTRHFACVFRARLTPDDEKELIEYLKSQPTNIDWSKVRV